MTRTLAAAATLTAVAALVTWAVANVRCNEDCTECAWRQRDRA